MEPYHAIFKEEIPVEEKIVKAYHFILDFYLEDGKKEIDLARAMGDLDRVVKTQIKLDTMRHASTWLADAVYHATGKVVRNDKK